MQPPETISLQSKCAYINKHILMKWQISLGLHSITGKRGNTRRKHE